MAKLTSEKTLGHGGIGKNCEAFFLDPLSGDLYVFTKNIGQCKVYTSPFPFSKTYRNDLKLIGKFDIKGEKVTATDISKDGYHVAVKSYNYIFYWDITENEKLVDMFKRLPTRLPYDIEPQGEAFCWKDGTESYLTISESNNGIETRLIEYKD